MKIKIILPPMLQLLTGKKETVYVKGTTVRECLVDFQRQFPDSGAWFNENGPIAWITLNQKIIGKAEMDHKVTRGDDLRFVLLLAGG